MLYLCYLCRFKPLRDHLRGFLIAAWAGDKIAEFSFPEISFHFSLRPWFFFVSPAYAGKSPAAAYACPGTQDHPRVCGEKAEQIKKSSADTGSPPHVRGKDICVFVGVDCRGITPACAGKRRKSQPRTLPGWDHPRMCGEKKLRSVSTISAIGSPPRMRGKDAANSFRTQFYGITPAYAGKS